MGEFNLKLGGVILCGGQSKRMGVAKATLPFGPETMLQRVCRILKEVVEPIVVVGGPRQDLPNLANDVHVVRDRAEGKGPLEGLAVGLRTMAEHADAAYVTGCDVPLLVPDFVRYLAQVIVDHEIAVPFDDSYHHPLAAIYRTDLLPTIERLIAGNRMRPLFLFEESRTLKVATTALMTVDPNLQTLQNLNHPNDYLAALEQAGFEPPDNFSPPGLSS